MSNIFGLQRDISASDGKNAIAFQQDKFGDRAHVLFLHGFRSDMTGDKVRYLEQFCAQNHLTFTRLDYRGHGQSGGHYTEFGAQDWLDDVLQIVDKHTNGPLVVVGSSLGGWLMFLLAKARPDRIQALVGIAAAPDFPTELALKAATPEQLAAFERSGQIVEESAYSDEPNIFSARLFESVHTHSFFASPFATDKPVRLLQGTEDVPVPVAHAHRILRHIEGDDVTLTLIKGGDHRLSTPHNLSILGQTISALIAS
jgi:pimeloyl-ACP methyl ester carboxylesterase